jgi:hypothetical protein
MNSKQLFCVGAAGGEKPNDGTTITDYVDVNREQTGCLLMQNNFGKARGHKSAVQQGSGLIPSRTKNEVVEYQIATTTRGGGREGGGETGYE